MRRFVIIRNTLQYEYQWSVFNSDTGEDVGEYRTKHLAEKARRSFEGHPLTKRHHDILSPFKNDLETTSGHVGRPEDDPQPEKSRYSNKRPVRLE